MLFRSGGNGGIGGDAPGKGGAGGGNDSSEGSGGNGGDGGQDDEQKRREEYERQERERVERERKEAAEKYRQEMERRRQEYERQQREKFEAARREMERIKREQERQRQEHIDRLCKKYNTTPDKLRDVLTKNRDDAAKEAEAWNKVEKVLWVGEKMATATVVVSDTLIDGMASCGGPGAKAARAGYKIIKGAAASGADKGWTTESIVGGAVSGGADAATDFISNPYAKAATTIVGETAAGAITGGVEGAKDGFVNGVYNAGMNAATDKIAGDGFGNETKMDFHKNGKATVSVKTSSGWVDKTVSGSTAIKFHNKKIGQQVKTSAIKGTVGMGNELGAKPTLQDKGILPK